MYTRAPDDMPNLTAGIILFDNEMNFLLVKQRKNGIWSFPKGSVKYGETTIEGALREGFEESGFNAPLKHMVSIYVDTIYDKTVYLYIFKLPLKHTYIPIQRTSDTSDFIWLNWYSMPHNFMKYNSINKVTMNYLNKSVY